MQGSARLEAARSSCDMRFSCYEALNIADAVPVAQCLRGADFCLECCELEFIGRPGAVRPNRSEALRISLRAPDHTVDLGRPSCRADTSPVQSGQHAATNRPLHQSQQDAGMTPPN